MQKKPAQKERKQIIEQNKSDLWAARPREREFTEKRGEPKTNKRERARAKRETELEAVPVLFYCD